MKACRGRGREPCVRTKDGRDVPLGADPYWAQKQRQAEAMGTIERVPASEDHSEEFPLFM